MYACMHTHVYVSHLPLSACEDEHGHVEMSESASEKGGKSRSGQVRNGVGAREGERDKNGAIRRLNNISVPTLPVASAKGRRYVL